VTVDLSVLDVRPSPGRPRPYHFPHFERRTLANGAQLVTADLPGRPLVAVRLILEGGATYEPPDRGGVSILAAHALTEGTERYTAIELVEAAERLGAELSAEAGWDSFSLALTVPAHRLEPAMAPAGALPSGTRPADGLPHTCSRSASWREGGDLDENAKAPCGARVRTGLCFRAGSPGRRRMMLPRVHAPIPLVTQPSDPLTM